MRACTWPGRTVRSTPLRISVPSTATCRPSISKSGVAVLIGPQSNSTMAVGENPEEALTRTVRVPPHMAEPWTYAGEVPMLGTAGTVTLVEGSAFAISGRSGDMAPNLPQGFFFRDTRFLSRLELRVNGQPVEALEAEPLDPFSATFALRTRPRPGRADSPLLLFRHRYVGRGMREDIVIRNYGDEPSFCSLELLFDTDFADLFHVKEGRLENDVTPGLSAEGDDIVFRYQRGLTRRGVRISFSQRVQLAANLATFEIIVPPQESWET